MNSRNRFGLPQNDTLIAALLLLTIGLVLIARLIGRDWLWYIAWTSMAGTVSVTLSKLRMREFYLLGLSGLIATYIWNTREDHAEMLNGALDQAGFLMVFILLLAMLREAAMTSPSIADLGAFMTRQKPGRRYVTLYSGTGFMAVIFNVGVVSFLVPLIQRGIAQVNAQDGRDQLRERRQVSAMLRGFAWSVVWSPTALAPLALMELIPDVDRVKWIALGFVAAVFALLIGWAEDKWRFRHYKPSGNAVALPLPTRALFLFFATCTWLLGLTALVSEITGDSMVFGLMVSCPLMLVGWLVVQNGFGTESRKTIQSRLREILFQSVPQSAAIAVTLACSGFLGRAGAGIVPGNELVNMLGLYDMPDWFLLATIPIVLCLFSLLAFSPIMMAIFFGSLFGNLQTLPADPTMIALSISIGWAVSMTFSPFATVALLTQRVSGIRASQLTLNWNLMFSVLVILFLFPFFLSLYL